MTSCLRWKPKVMCRGWWDWQPCLVISVLVTQSGWTLSYPVDCNSPGSSVHWILQARLLEWVTVPFSRGSSQPRDWIWLSRIAGRFFIIWATREVPSNTHTHTHTHTHWTHVESVGWCKPAEENCSVWTLSLSHITLNRWLSVALPSGRRKVAAQPKSPGATPGQHPGLDGVGSLQWWARYSLPWESPPGFFLSSDLADWFQWMVPRVRQKSWVLGRGMRAIACLRKIAQPLREQKLTYNRKLCLEASSQVHHLHPLNEPKGAKVPEDSS